MNLFEIPWYYILAGTTVTALLFGKAWLQSGDSWRLKTALGVLAAGLLFIAIERLVVNDRERIRATLDQIVLDAERNDLDAILAHIHPSRDDLSQIARGEMGFYRIDDVDIKSNLKVEVHPSRQPPHAEVTFNVVVRGNIKDFQESLTLPQFVRLTFLLDEGRWKVSDFSRSDPREGMRDLPSPAE